MSLNPQFMISPNLQEFFIDPDTNLPMTDGNVFYYSDISRSDLKPVYLLSGTAGSYSYTALPNPVPLSGAGTPMDGPNGNDIRVYYYPYNAQGGLELYYIVVKDSNGNTKLVRQAWPNISNPDEDNGAFSYNFIRNGSFSSWSNGTVYSGVKTGSVSTTDYLVDDWIYKQDDTSQVINVSRGTFIPGDDSVPGNPPFYLIYEDTSSGSGLGTFNYFQQYFTSVQTLNDKNVTAEIWLNQAAGAAGNFSLELIQYFGTGGSPSDEVSQTVILIPTMEVGEWTRYSGTALLPSIFGKTIGTNGDDKLLVNLNMPLNQTAKVYICKARLEEGLIIAGSQEISNDDIARQTNTLSLQANFKTGDVKPTIRAVSDPGWLLMDDTTIGNPSSGATHIAFSYFALFSLLWNNIHDVQWAPIFTSAGVISTYGANALADWNANKRLSLTKTLGRVLASAGQAHVSTTFTVDALDDILFISDSSSFYTGVPVTVSSTGTLPSPLIAGTTYYVVNLTSTTISLANTAAEAADFTLIDITTVGTGTLTITINYTNWLPGQYIGEENTSTTIGNMPKHNHPGSTTAIPESSTLGPGSSFVVGSNATVGTLTTTVAVQGGSLPLNNIQPTTYLRTMIKL